MHIKEARKQLKNAVTAYNAKDEFGRPRIPLIQQRPVFLVGAPGIGKTAIVRQIAEEMDLAFVSYSMTHHTRQSALGLPYIVEKTFADETFSVSEYTMSEIIASVYEEMEKTGKKEGILFLDEINCVSETLAPSMLQFLQYKTFGRHRVPDGWIIVTAGNPAEYNDSVREFDIAMLDRIKKIEVEPDYEVWKEFAAENGVHAAVLSYLATHPEHFYRVTTSIDGKSFVTARSWDDLSEMIRLYEENNLTCDIHLISQYLQDSEIAADFTNYYDLYRKYGTDYQVESILAGTFGADIVMRAKKASFDERHSVILLILSAAEEKIRKAYMQEETLREIVPRIVSAEDIKTEIKNLKEQYTKESELTAAKENNELSLRKKKLCTKLAESILHGAEEAEIKNDLRSEVKHMKKTCEEASDILDHIFTFFEQAFGSGQEMLILVSELTIRPSFAKFLISHPNTGYNKYNKQLLFDERRDEIRRRIGQLNMPDAQPKEGENK